jgi:hypothetical protein
LRRLRAIEVRNNLFCRTVFGQDFQYKWTCFPSLDTEEDRESHGERYITALSNLNQNRTEGWNIACDLGTTRIELVRG